VCTDCWGGYLNSAIESGKKCITQTCPQKGCNVLVPRQIFEKHCAPDKLERYKHFFKGEIMEGGGGRREGEGGREKERERVFLLCVVNIERTTGV
jgi:hypothetical protein